MTHQISEADVKAFAKAAKKVTREATRSPEAARAYLVRLGVVTPKGNLRKRYKS